MSSVLRSAETLPHGIYLYLSPGCKGELTDMVVKAGQQAPTTPQMISSIVQPARHLPAAGIILFQVVFAHCKRYFPPACLAMSVTQPRETEHYTSTISQTKRLSNTHPRLYTHTRARVIPRRYHRCHHAAVHHSLLPVVAVKFHDFTPPPPPPLPESTPHPTSYIQHLFTLSSRIPSDKETTRCAYILGLSCVQ